LLSVHEFYAGSLRQQIILPTKLPRVYWVLGEEWDHPLQQKLREKRKKKKEGWC
jgi:hypothetical protein